MLGSMLLQLDPLVADLHLESSTISSLRSGLHSERIKNRQRVREKDQALQEERLFLNPTRSLIFPGWIHTKSLFFLLSLKHSHVCENLQKEKTTHRNTSKLCISCSLKNNSRVSNCNENVIFKQKSVPPGAALSHSTPVLI